MATRAPAKSTVCSLNKLVNLPETLRATLNSMISPRRYLVVGDLAERAGQTTDRRRASRSRLMQRSRRGCWRVP